VKVVLAFVMVLVALVSDESGKEVRGSTAAPDPQALFLDFVAAINAGDLERAMSQLNPDEAVLSPLGPRGATLCPHGVVCSDRGAIRDYLTKLIADKYEIWIVRIAVSGDGISAGGLIQVNSRETATAGVERLVFRFQAAELGGKLVKITFEPDPTDPITVSFFSAVPPVQPPSTGDGGLIATLN
jgi:hypothetical protein